MTNKEAMRLALEALEYIRNIETDVVSQIKYGNASQIIETELAKPDFWEGYVPEPVKAAQQALDEMAWNAKELGLDYEPAQPVVWHDAPQTIYLQVCPEADHCEVRFADHDEVTWCQDKIHDSDIAYVRASTTQQPPAQQKPVAYLVDGDLYYPEEIDWETLQEQGHTVAPLYTSPPAQQSCYCPNCEALSKELAELKAQKPFGYFKAMPFGWTDCAETDEGAVALYERPPAQRTWVGLTLSDREKLRDQFEGWSYPAILVDAVSDILKEKNT